AVVGSTIVTSTLMRNADSEIVYSEIIDSHLRALVASKPVDVASTDQHTVKPWFNGKSTQSPTVIDTAPQGYPLIDGRIDVIKGTQVPVVVYGRRQHLISVWTMPQPLAGDVRSGSRTLDGYNVLSWIANGTGYVAVSDLAKDELDAFAKLLQAAQ